MRPEQVVSVELAQALCRISREIGRQVGVFIDRRGQLESVFVGDATGLQLPDFGRIRAGRGRFRGLRLVHTHLQTVSLTRDDLTDLALLRLDLVAALLQPDEDSALIIEFAHLVPGDPDRPAHQVEGPTSVHQLDVDLTELLRFLEDTFDRARTVATTGGKKPSILVCVTNSSAQAAEPRLREMRELCRTADIDLLEIVHQRRTAPDPRFVVGRGKLRDIVIRAMQLGVEFVIFDPDLTPTQARAISDFTDLKVIDRTMLILDIFAQRATSREGKIQVELAQLRYALPRLVAKNTMMSRLTGEIGGRGPGETKLEINRRRARDRLTLLEHEISKISRQRALTRRRRHRRDLPTVAIVGYTNAGKSTLLNALTASDVFTEDKLFATLDPTSRRLRLGPESDVILTDTVGFIRELPPDLARAFRATLEELNEADLFLHVVDSAEPGADDRIEAVERILAEMDLGAIARLTVYNKVDRLAQGPESLTARRPDALCVSALDPSTCHPLVTAIQKMVSPGKP